ncbi:proteoglycan 4b isoform X1 [Clupea harengus]|uniref:Proteoglycan 4b isoform X1 n=1 Tax=Clupea harengus TaxID=7950 RepID=A0A6P3WCU1_CLUHA|nr:proteoglycan 4b isoform X1 [Clupea harengus]
MTRSSLYALLVLMCVMFTYCSAQMSSCTGRCGESYYRGYLCHCDYDCLTHEECCQDYEAKCTTSGSCKGRCSESFKRGRECDCDPDCDQFNKCCPDHKEFCSPEEAAKKPANAAAVGPNPCINAHASKPADPPMPQDPAPSESEDENEGINGELDTPEEPPLPEGTSGYEPPATTVSESPVPTIAVGTPMATVADDAEAVLEAELEGEGLSLDDPTPSPTEDTPPAVPDPTSVPSASPASQTPSTKNPDTTQTKGTVAPADSLVTTPASTPPSEEGNSTASTEAPANDLATTAPPKADDPSNDLATTAPPEVEDSSNDLATTGPPKAEDPSNDLATTAPPKAQDPSNDLTTTAPQKAQDPSNDLATTATPKAQDASENAGTPSAKPTEAQDVITTKHPLTASVTMPSATQDPAATPIPSEITDKPLEMTSKPLETTAKPEEKITKGPKVTPLPSKPTKKPEKPGIDNTKDYQSDDSNDTDLCSGRPVNGLTTLKNGTTAVFRGHYFWMLDARKVPGPARGITDVWGIPTPIDTVFTRCNCQGKTYFLKDRSYWRFENDVMDPGYPKATRTGFDGLSGHITAALSVPAYMKRRESVYFFKRGGRVQKYSYDPKKAPKCGSQPSPRVHYAVHSRRTRQTETYLGRELNIKVSWKGFPTTVTSAVSTPSRLAADGYNYHIFSRTRHYSIKVDAERPTLTTPVQATPAQSPPKSYFNCPEKTKA